MGIYNMLRQSAATLGLAIMSMVFINTRDHQFAADLKTNMATQNLDPMVFEGMLTRTSEALQALALLTPTVRDQVIFFFTDAYLTAFKSVNVIGVWFGIAGLIVAFFTLRHYRTDP
jgi:cbb3-type cytochrome oxidase subunit 3